MSARNGIRNESRDVLGWLAMLACVVIAAHGEWSLAVAAGYQSYVAAALPVAVDAYAIRSMQAGREVLAPVLLMIATNAAAHLVHTGLLHVGPALVVAVSAIAPVVLWRVHALRRGAANDAPDHVVGAAEMVPDHFRGAAKVMVERESEPAEPAPEPDPVPPAVEETRTPVLGPLLPLAQLLAAPAPEPAGTVPEQHERAADERPEPGVEPAEPEPEPQPVPEVPGGQFGEDVVTVRTWLAVEPQLTGTEIGTRLGKSDSYGRRVRRAAEAVTV
jgi:hypothetical protein